MCLGGGGWSVGYVNNLFYVWLVLCVFGFWVVFGVVIIIEYLFYNLCMMLFIVFWVFYNWVFGLYIVGELNGNGL